MSKKRKTKAQKLSSAGRRQRQLSNLIKTDRAKKPTATIQKSPTAAVSDEYVLNPRPQLAQSMKLLGILVLMQLIIWLVFRFSNLDTTLLDKIRV